MIFSYLVFLFFGGLAVASAILMITRRNIVHSAVFFLTAILATGGIFLQLRAEFLFGVQIILFGGAVVVLFVFVFLLLKPDFSFRKSRFTRQERIAVVLASVLGAQLLVAASIGSRTFNFPVPSDSSLPANTSDLARSLFQKDVLPLEMAALLLLIAMIGAAVMAKRRA